MIRRPPRSTQSRSSAASDVYKRQTRIEANGTLYEISRDDGLTDAEGIVGDHVCAAVNAFAKLPCEHPSELRDFCDAVHCLQGLLTTRIARRHYPKGWPVKGDSAMPAEAADPVDQERESLRQQLTDCGWSLDAVDVDRGLMWTHPLSAQHI